MKTSLLHNAMTPSGTRKPDPVHRGEPSAAEVTHAAGSGGGLTSQAPLCVTIIDVGKGDCILLRSGGRSILIDAGYKDTVPYVLSQLQAQGVSRLDALIITHYDRDHVDGIRPICEAVSVGTIYLPGYEGSDRNYRSCVSSVKALGVPCRRVTEELSLTVAAASLTVFPSGVDYEAGAGKVEGNDNDMSLVATFVFGRDTYLFTGDLEEEGICAYLAGNHGRFGVLKVPHHGEHAANTSALLDDACPTIAVITDSMEDAADKKTLKLLKSAGIETYRTSTDGTVIITSNGSGTYTVSSSKGRC